MSPIFVHLNLHTEYSINDGIVRIDELLQRCVTFNMPAVAITDLTNFFGVVKFYKAALKLGIKPILGTDCWFFDAVNPKEHFKITLLAQNETGYRNLLKLLSRAYIEGQTSGKPLINKQWIFEASAGIIALSGGAFSDIGKALLSDDTQMARELLNNWQQIFPECFYLTLERLGRAYDGKYVEAAVLLAEEQNVPVVATGAVRFLNKGDFEAHEARVCIHDGYVVDDPKRPRIYTEEQYLYSPEEMAGLFQDIPEALTNTVEIAKRCNVVLPLHKTFLPIFPVPDNFATPEDCFTEQARQGLVKRLAEIFREGAVVPLHTKEDYTRRLEHELVVIKQMGFASYFLIVADFINWAQQNDIPVGPGRGSGAGSLVAYALYITDVDPLEHALLFERFLNPERVSLPDFDIDFCMDGRDRVIDYVIKRYGHERVAQIVTHGTMAAKAVVRDVGRVLAYPYGFVDKIAKLIPFALGMTLELALQQEEVLRKRYEEDEEVKALIDLALKLEGITRNVGKHAGGIVIAPTLLTDFTPLYCEPGAIEHSMTQYDKDDVEAIGLVKFDFLGLRTLTIIATAVKNINRKLAETGESPLNISQLPLDDPESYKLIKSGTTTAVFQIESRGMKELTKRLQPDRFDEIVALIALYRPGPLQSGMVDDFVDRKHGRAPIIYQHPLLESILKPTYGVILYQEQVMQIAQVLAGYSLGGADILRRAMGKKKSEEMAKQRAHFIDGAQKNNIDKHIANSIFDAMEKFAGYGFNKSHSVAYALIAYRTAWLKAHYPAYFMAAVLSADMDNTDKIVKLIAECKSMGLKIIPPHINNSDYQFTGNASGEIVFGLGAIKGVGEAAIENIIASRKQNGNFKNLFDLGRQVDKRKINRKVLEALIKSGALDNLGANRSTLFASIDIALRVSEQCTRDKEQGQLSLFGNADLEDDLESDTCLYAKVVPWDVEEELNGEKSTLGFYLSGHPLERFMPELNKFATGLSELAELQGQNVVTAGFIVSLRPIITKSGKNMGILIIEDVTSTAEIVIFSDVYNVKREFLMVDKLVVIEGEVNIDGFSGNARMRAKDILTLEEARAKYASCFTITLNTATQKNLQAKLVNELAPLLKNSPAGTLPICIDYIQPKARAKFLLGEKWRVKPTDNLLQELKKMFGEESIWVHYKNKN